VITLDRQAMSQLIDWESVMSSVEEGMRDEGNGLASGLPRTLLRTAVTPDGDPVPIIVMAAGSRGKGFAAIRTMGGRPFRFTLLLFDGAGEPVAYMDFAHLQLYRTGAVAAVASKYFARTNATRLAIIGSGHTAKAAAVCHSYVRDFKEVRVYSRTEENRVEFARTVSPFMGLDVEPCASPMQAIEGADIVVVSGNIQRLEQEPVFKGAWMSHGMHVTALGGPGDLDQECFARANRFVVDDLGEVRKEVLDTIKAVDSGLLPPWDQIDTMPQVVVGQKPARTNEQDITLVRTRGSAVQDLYPAADIYLRAIAKNIGRDVGEVTATRDLGDRAFLLSPHQAT